MMQATWHGVPQGASLPRKLIYEDVRGPEDYDIKPTISQIVEEILMVI